MHFAGLKAVGESVEQPLRYYRVNLTASMNLLEVSFDFCHLTVCPLTPHLTPNWPLLVLIIILICWVHDSVSSFDSELANSNTAPFNTSTVSHSLSLYTYLLVYCMCVCRLLSYRWLYVCAMFVCICMYPRWCRLTGCTIWSSAAQPQCMETLSICLLMSSTLWVAAPTPTARPSTSSRRWSRITVKQKRY